MSAQSAPRFGLWIPAIRAEILPLSRLVAWADEQLLGFDHPPPWLIELSLATDLDAVERARELVQGGRPEEELRMERIYLGSLFVAHEQGRCSMYDLLLRAGQFADRNQSASIPECEQFFYLLNEIEESGPTFPSDRPLAERVREIFEPMAAEARALFITGPEGMVVRRA